MNYELTQYINNQNKWFKTRFKEYEAYLIFHNGSYYELCLEDDTIEQIDIRQYYTQKVLLENELYSIARGKLIVRDKRFNLLAIQIPNELAVDHKDIIVAEQLDENTPNLNNIRSFTKKQFTYRFNTQYANFAVKKTNLIGQQKAIQIVSSLISDTTAHSNTNTQEQNKEKYINNKKEKYTTNKKEKYTTNKKEYKTSKDKKQNKPIDKRKESVTKMLIAILDIFDKFRDIARR